MTDKSAILIDLRFDRESVLRALPEAFPDRTVIDMGDPAIVIAISPVHPMRLSGNRSRAFPACKRLEGDFLGGAGVDHILSNYNLPDLPIVRFVDRSLTDRMSEWVVWQSLHHLRNGFVYADQQRSRVWREMLSSRRPEM